MGFPTANIQLEDERKLLPASGVYAVKVYIGDDVYGGMLNIGVRPTVSCFGILRIEVNIFDFSEDIYGKKIRLALLARIRGEQKFEDTNELKQQLVRDQKKAEEYLAK